MTSNKPPNRGRRILIATLVLGSIAGYGAWARWWQGSWKEEVQLSDGTRIVIRQREVYNNPGLIDYFVLHRRNFREIAFLDSELNVPLFRQYGFDPFVLDRDRGTGEWFIIGTVWNEFSWQHSFRAKTMYTEFRLRGDRWVPQDVSPNNWWRWTNLLIGEPKPDMREDIVPADNKMEKNARLATPLTYFQIRRDEPKGEAGGFSFDRLVPEQGVSP